MKGTKALNRSDFQKELSRFCALLSNPTRIAIIEKLSCEDSCNVGDFVEIEGLSKFAVGMNLKYLKKYKMVTGDLSSKKMHYCLDFNEIERFKQLFDEFYTRISEHKNTNSKEEC